MNNNVLVRHLVKTTYATWDILLLNENSGYKYKDQDAETAGGLQVTVKEVYNVRFHSRYQSEPYEGIFHVIREPGS